MSTVDLASLGISVGVGSSDSPNPVAPSATTDNALAVLTASFAATTLITSVTLGYAAFKLRRVLRRYLSDAIEYLFANRQDYEHRLIYEMYVRGQLIHTVTIGQREQPDSVLLEEVVTISPASSYVTVGDDSS